MLLRTKPLIINLLLATSLVACDGSASDCEPAAPAVEPIGAELYSVDYYGAPPQTLHRYGERIQLVQNRGQPAEVRATLSPEVLELVQQTQAALASGILLASFDDQCLLGQDTPRVTLSLRVSPSSLGFRYPWTCPPEGLAELDAALRELIVALPTCEPTPLMYGCSITDE